jgi:hypothetical protein
MGKVISIYTKHDANVTISENENVIKYIEFEKITDTRYFSFSNKKSEFQ